MTEDGLGAMAVNQAHLRTLAEERIADARALIDGARWGFAYYAAGYAVECPLKSCVLARMVDTGWVFNEEVKNISDCRTHEFQKLIHIAGLTDHLNTRLKQSADKRDRFIDNWILAKAWTVSGRYEANSELDARKLYAAITDDPDGVLKWIKNYW